MTREDHEATSGGARDAAWPQFVVSPSGATKTCCACGTIYDLHGVDLLEQMTPLGDGCALCAPELSRTDEVGAS